MTGFDIGGKHVGDGAPCLIVGEVAQAHHGSYDLAHAFIDAIADAGAGAVKFQAHIAEAESWHDEPWRVKPRWGNETRFEYWRRMEFTLEQWGELCAHARLRRLGLIVSPFSVSAAWLVHGFVDAWKVASGEVCNWDLLARLAAWSRPVILSTGMSTKEETHDAGYYLAEERCPGIALLHCTSMYPCPPEAVGLGRMVDLRRSYGNPVGLSDHSGTIYAGLAAVALGCDLLEVHVKFSDYDPGPDASSSITVEQLKQLVEGVRFIEKAKQPVDKDEMAKELAPMRALFMDRHKRRAEHAGTGEPEGEDALPWGFMRGRE